MEVVIPGIGAAALAALEALVRTEEELGVPQTLRRPLRRKNTSESLLELMADRFLRFTPREIAKADTIKTDITMIRHIMLEVGAVTVNQPSVPSTSSGLMSTIMVSEAALPASS